MSGPLGRRWGRRDLGSRGEAERCGEVEEVPACSPVSEPRYHMEGRRGTRGGGSSGVEREGGGALVFRESGKGLIRRRQSAGRWCRRAGASSAQVAFCFEIARRPRAVYTGGKPVDEPVHAVLAVRVFGWGAWRWPVGLASRTAGRRRRRDGDVDGFSPGAVGAWNRRGIAGRGGKVGVRGAGSERREGPCRSRWMRSAGAAGFPQADGSRGAARLRVGSGGGVARGIGVDGG